MRSTDLLVSWFRPNPVSPAARKPERSAPRELIPGKAGPWVPAVAFAKPGAHRRQWGAGAPEGSLGSPRYLRVSPVPSPHVTVTLNAKRSLCRCRANGQGPVAPSLGGPLCYLKDPGTACHHGNINPGIKEPGRKLLVLP